MKLTIATSQFPLEEELKKNFKYIKTHMQQAADKGADVVHFSETALSGYAGIDFPSLDGYDWDALTDAHHEVCSLAKQLKIWTILGSTHRLTGNKKPHNSLYIIDDKGKLIDRYDKMFCTGSPSCNDSDLKYYSPGNHMPVFKIKGITCGTQICHDFRYQEVYRAYKAKGAQLMFHSYHNARVPPAKYRKHCNVLPKNKALNYGINIHGTLVPATMQTYAANNAMWISATNSASKQSSWPAFFVRTDGIITGKLTRNRAGVLISKIDTEVELYDAACHWRERAMKGILHSGKLVKDKRSDARQAF